MFPARSAKTATELRMLAAVPTQVISPSKSKSIIGVVQDTLLGVYKSTKEDNPIEQKRFFNIMMANDIFNGDIKIRKKYTSHQLFSTFLPPINYKILKTTVTDDYIKDIDGLVEFMKDKGLIARIDNINFLEVSFIKKEAIDKIDNILKKHGHMLSTKTKKILEMLKNRINNKKTIRLIKEVEALKTSLPTTGKKTTKIVFEIKQGKFITGVMGKDQYKPGGGNKNLIYRTWQDYGPEPTRFLVDQTQKIMNQWLIEEGHTIGAGDIYVQSADIQNEVTLAILASMEAYARLEQSVIEGKLIPGIGRSVEDEFEFQAKLVFDNLFSGELQKILTGYLKTTNSHLEDMIASGSKGSNINVTQIMGCVGPQAIGGKRIPKTYGDRTLPHYTKYDDSPEARGFVKNSYVTGLSPVEFFFHMSSGREGSIDTAIKSVTGDTPIVITEDGKNKRVLIGDWIDKKLSDKPNSVEHHKLREMELLKLENEVFIPTTNEKGNVSWGRITAITRHDPGKELYKIKTCGGREVIVTESKSLLIWNETFEEYRQTPTPEVKIGNFVPTTMYLPNPPFEDTSVLKPLDKYISDDWSITKEKIQSCVINCQVMIDEICMSCTLFGIFCQVVNTKNGKIIIIENPWAQKFYNIVKNVNLQGGHDINNNFAPQEDTILDKIVSIEKVDVKDYPKVYDLTVPSTLNFGLANGLHVVDTAESGYISRKLMKSMEDLMAHYDVVVRNSVGRIKQFIYGENGMNPIYCEHVPIDLIDYNIAKMKRKYKMNMKDFEDLLDKELYQTLFVKGKDAEKNKKLMKSEYLKILYYQRLLRNYIYKYETSADITFLSPVRISRVIENALVELDVDDKFKPFVDPVYMIKKINGLCKVLPQLFEKSEFNVGCGVPFNDDQDLELIKGMKEDELLNSNNKIDFEEMFDVLEKEKNKYAITTLLFRIYLKSILGVKDIMTKYKMTKECFDYIIDQILYKFSRAIIDGGEMVGALAAQSIGEPTTQATLNSVDHKQKILVGKKIGEKNGKLILDIKEVRIGKFVDNIINNLVKRGINRTNNSNFQYYNYTNERSDKAEYGEISKMKYYAISANKDGYLRWNKITGVSKHIPINEDGSDKLLKVTLNNGSVIRATAGHSFMVRECDGLVEKEGKTLKVGDLLPVMKDFPISDIYMNEYLDIAKYFPKNEYIWGCEMKKAKKFMEKMDSVGERHWYSAHNGIEFTLPYNRSDTVRCAFSTTPRIRNGIEVSKTKQQFQDGYIYPMRRTDNMIPEKIKLDEDFGFFIGIYLAEGNLNGKRKNKVLISNNDKRIRDKVEKFVKRFNINCHTQIQNDKFKKGWTSSTITVHSAMLANFIEKTCKVYSQNKVVPSFAYNSNEEFMKGILSGYISGDGCIDNKNALIRCISVSKKLLKGIGKLLSILGYYYKINTPAKRKSNNLGTLPENIKQQYRLIISSSNTIKLLNCVKIYKKYNDDRIEKLKSRKSKYSFGLNDYIPNVKIGDKIETIHRDKLSEYVNKYPELQKIIDSDVCYNKIIKIEKINPSNGYTYDITVDDDHTFMTDNIIIKNTFHFAGVAAKSSVIGGVPRLKELLRATKKIKTPLTQAYLHPDFADDKYRAKAIANSIEYTTLRLYTNRVDIYFDPNPKDTIIKEDIPFVKEFFKYTVVPINILKLSKFVLRIELNKRKIIYKQLRMNYIKYVIESYKNGQYFVINSDDNAEKLVLHIRVDMSNISNKASVEQDQIFKAKDVVLDEIVIRGIKNINSAQIDNSGEKLIVYNPETGQRELKDQWIIYTDGTNLKYILGEPGIDARRTISNDVYEVFTILGIEAARQLLYNEFSETFAATGAVLDYHHLGLLVDIMSYYGQLMPISRHGINRTDNSPLAKASFEETLEQLGEAAVYGVKDIMTGISSNIMCGQMMPAGTGANFDVLYDLGMSGVTEDDIDKIFEDEEEIIVV